MKKLLITLLLCSIFVNANCQVSKGSKSTIENSNKIKIQVDEKIIETEYVALTPDQIFTKDGNFYFDKINKITFSSFNKTQLGLYNDLIQKSKIEFEDGTEINSSNIDDVVLKANKELLNDSGDYLIQASGNAIAGIVIPIVGAGISIATGNPWIGYGTSIIGVGLQINAWLKVKKAGKALKVEQANK
jgi:hypothetical protein